MEKFLIGFASDCCYLHLMKRRMRTFTLTFRNNIIVNSIISIRVSISIAYQEKVTTVLSYRECKAFLEKTLSTAQEGTFLCWQPASYVNCMWKQSHIFPPTSSISKESFCWSMRFIMEGFARGTQGDATGGLCVGALLSDVLLLDVLELLLRLEESKRLDSSHSLSWGFASLLFCTSAAGTVFSCLSSVPAGRLAGLWASVAFIRLLAISSFTVARKEGESFFLECFCNLDSFLASFSSLPSSAGLFPFSTGEGIGQPLPSACCALHRLSLDKVFINRLAVLLRFRGGGLEASLLEDTEFILPIFCKGVPETWEYKEEKALATVVSTSIWRKRPAQEHNIRQSLRGPLVSSQLRIADLYIIVQTGSDSSFLRIWRGNFHHNLHSPTPTNIYLYQESQRWTEHCLVQ